MAIYLLSITPEPIPDADYPKAFSRLIGCNPAFQDPVFNGIVTFAKVQVGTLWSSLMQMNDESVRDSSSLTVVWSANPFDEMQDRKRRLYQQNRAAITEIVDSWARELGTRRGDALLYHGDVCWILENADTGLLTKDFAHAKRGKFTVVEDTHT